LASLISLSLQTAKEKGRIIRMRVLLISAFQIAEQERKADSEYALTDDLVAEIAQKIMKQKRKNAQIQQAR
jgi:hypothetical protein